MYTSHRKLRNGQALCDFFIDEFYMTVKVTKNRYSRQNCVGNYFPYVDDIVKYPLTALPVMYEMSEVN